MTPACTTTARTTSEGGKPYQLRVIGLGNRSRALMRAAEASGRFQVAALSDGWDEPGGPVGVGAEEAPEATYVPRWRDLLATDVDAVVIAVPNDLHAAMVTTALEAERHVLCEKPVAISPEETRRVLGLTQGTTRVLQVGMELRYSPAVRDLVAGIRSGQWPAAQLVWAQEFRPPLRPGVRGWRLTPARSGGTLLEKNCHHFDLFCLIVADRPVAVHGAANGPADLLDSAVVTLRFAGGATASLTMSMTQPEQRLRLGALGGEWNYEYDSRGEVSRVVDGRGRREHRWPADSRGPDAGCWDHPGEDEQFAAFARRLDGHSPATEEQTPALWSHLVAFAAERAVRERREVLIDAEGDLR